MPEMAWQNATYVSELYNIVSQVGEVDFGRGLRLKQITGECLSLIDRSTHRIYGRWQHFSPWFLVQEPIKDASLFVDGDPTGAMRVLRITLIIFFGEDVNFGPVVHIIRDDNGKPGGIVNWDNLTSRFPICKPDEFTITSQDIQSLTILFGDLITGHVYPITSTPIHRLLAAKVGKARPSDAIIDLSIALEALYLSNEGNKGILLAQRAAAFLASVDLEREDTYIKARSFYKARNKIIHEGQEHPTIHLKNSTSLDSIQLRDWAFKHLRQAISKVAADKKYNTMSKSSFVKELKAMQIPFKQQLESLEKNCF